MVSYPFPLKRNPKPGKRLTSRSPKRLPMSQETPEQSSWTPLPDHLPAEEIIIEPEVDTTDMIRIGEEVTKELEYTPVRFYIKCYCAVKAREMGNDQAII